MFTIENLVKMEENFFRVPINLYAKAMSELHGFMHSDEYKQRTEQLEEFIYFVSYHRVYYYYRGKTSDDDGGKQDSTRVPYSSRDDILPGLKDILRTIPRHNMLKSAKHLQFLEHCGLASLLAKLLDTSENKEIAKECVTLFLIDPKTSSGFFFPRSIQSQCAPIILNFCGLFRHATDADEQQLYDSCRETLVSILKSIAFANRKRYFGIASTLDLWPLQVCK